MAWSSSPTTVTLRWPAASRSTRAAWLRLVSWNSSTRTYRKRAATAVADRPASRAAGAGRGRPGRRSRRSRSRPAGAGTSRRPRPARPGGRRSRRPPRPDRRRRPARRPGRGALDGRRLDGQPLGVVGVGGRADVLVLAAAEQGRQRGQEAGRVAERPVVVEVELVEVLAQEDDRLGPGQDAQVRGQAELQGELADERVAEGVERRDPAVRVAVRDELVDAHRHLVGRLVGEGQGQDLRRPGPLAWRSARRSAG